MITVDEIRRWRREMYKAGYPSALKDFFISKGICPVCHGTGDIGQPLGAPKPVICETCQGTGVYENK